MKVLFFAAVFLAAVPDAFAQGIIGQTQTRAGQADQLVISEKDEVAIGTTVSLNLRRRYGVFQNEAIHRYVTLVGLSLIDAAERPDLNWTFIVLDTDGVNAFAAPGGFIHVTRGLLGLVNNEAELAAVLAHEIGHIDGRHTLEELRRAAAGDIAQQELFGSGGLVSFFARRSYESIIENKFDRNDEIDADARALRLTHAARYSPGAFARVLERIRERNKDIQDVKFRNGLFASHPEIGERIQKIDEAAKTLTATALVASRFQAQVTLEPKDLAAIGVVDNEPEPVDPEEKGSLLGGLRRRAQNLPGLRPTTTTASASVRNVERDRYAVGGRNSDVVKFKAPILREEIVRFKQEIA